MTKWEVHIKHFCYMPKYNVSLKKKYLYESCDLNYCSFHGKIITIAILTSVFGRHLLKSETSKAALQEK